MKLNFQSLFGSTFISVILALVLYDFLVKGLVGRFLPSGYDATDFEGASKLDNIQLFEANGKVYRVIK